MGSIAGEQERLYRVDIKDIKAYDKYLRGLECFYQDNRQHNAQARRFFEQASKLEETSALISGMLGFTHILDFIYSWIHLFQKEYGKAIELVNQAIIINPEALSQYIFLSSFYIELTRIFCMVKLLS